MTDQALELRCWSCKETFHIRLKTSEQTSLNKVRKIVPCPFCTKGCSLILREDQVASEIIQRGGDNGNQANANAQGQTPPDLPPGAFLGQVFATEPVPATENNDNATKSPDQGE